MERMRRPRTPDAAVEAFSPDQVARLWYVLNTKPGWTGARDRALVAFLLGTGARASEACGLALGDVDFARRRAILHGKGQHDRRVTLGKGTFRALRDYLAVRPACHFPQLWVTLRREPLRYSALEMMIRRLGELADVDDCHPHRFRHTFATEYFRGCRDILAVRSALGHASVEVTMRYLRALGCDYAAESGARTPDEWLLG